MGSLYVILKKNVSVILICQRFRTHILLLRQEACNVDTKVALPWLPEFFFLFGGNGLIDSALVRFSPLLCERPLASREVQCELQQVQTSQFKVKDSLLGTRLAIDVP